MLPKVRLGRTGLQVTRIGMGGFPIAGVNKARGWDPYTPEGRATAIATVRAALDAGINYVDTAPVYGDGHSESIIGEATEGRRDEFVLASKIYFNGTGEDVKKCVEGSLKRLRTDVIDIIQFHGGMYSPQEVHKIVNGGLLDATFELRDEGKIRFVGFTTEEAWTGRAL
ncbi:MAG: aldo/keto reductase, partial [Phycisphaerae bacterium]|nr:aldo/keto reductase [Phycisphaerae bacterium]